MLWTAFLPVLGLSILYCLQAKKESSLLLASVGDDSDMKIVPPSGIAPSLEDAGEKAAQEFVAQKKNGNIDKAYSLGKRIAGVFFEENGPVLTFCEASLQPFICLQRKGCERCCGRCCKRCSRAWFGESKRIDVRAVNGVYL